MTDSIASPTKITPLFALQFCPRERVELVSRDLATRLKPGGRIVLIMTRWHEDDLGGRLLAQNPAEWRLLRLPALAEADDPLGRPEGAPLWPDWEDAAALARKRDTVGDRVWSALFQQTPRPPAGSLFRVNDIAVLDEVPASSGRVVRAWDLAATADDGRTTQTGRSASSYSAISPVASSCST